MKQLLALLEVLGLPVPVVCIAFVTAVVVLTSSPLSFGQTIQQPAQLQFSSEVTEPLKEFDKAAAERNYSAAVKALETAIPGVITQLGSSHGAVGYLEGQLGISYEGMGRLEDAIKAYQRSLAILEAIPSREEQLWQLRVNLANALSKAGKIREAISLYRMLLKHYEGSKGELHILTLTTRGVLAVSYAMSGQLDEAIAQGEILVETTRKVYGQDSEQQLDVEGLLANTLMQAKKFDLAAKAFNNVYRASERLRGELHAKTLVLGFGYALLLSEVGRSDQAVAIAEKVYRGRVATSATLQDVLQSQHLYAKALGRVGRFQEGDTLLSDGLRIAKEATPENIEITLTFMEGLCEIRDQWGHYADALVACRDSLRFAESSMGPDSLNASFGRQLLAGALSEGGDYEASSVLLENDLKLMAPKFGESHYNVLWTMSRLADFYAQSGRIEDARQLATKAYHGLLESFGASSPYTQNAGLGLAVIYVKLRQDAQALGLLEQIVEASDRQGGELNIRVKRELARTYILVGRKDDAEKVILAALKEAVSLYGLVPHRVTSSLLQVLVSVFGATGKATEALPIIEGLYTQSLKLLGPYHTETLSLLLQHAYLLLATKDFKRGIDVLGQGLDGIDAWRRITSVFDEGRGEEWANFSHHFRLAAVIGASQPSQGAMETSFVVADRAKTGTLYERLSIQKVLNKPGEESREFAKLMEIVRQIEKMDAQVTHEGELFKRVNLSLERKKLVAAHESLLRVLAKKFPALLQARIGETVDAKRIAESLGSDAVFISYLLYPEGGVAYVITRDAGLVIRRFDGIPKLAQTISAAREVARTHRSIRGVTIDGLWRLQDGSYLYGKKPKEDAKEVKDPSEIYGYLGQLFIKPIANEIKGKKRLIVSPDELIALLPLEMLAFEGQYLVERFDISYVQSGAMFLLMVDQQKRSSERPLNTQRTLLAAGGVEHGQLSNSAGTRTVEKSRNRTVRSLRDLGLEWEPLPASKKEVESVGSLFDDKNKLLLLGGAASEERLRKLNAEGALKRYRYLLFSAHGYLSDGDPQLNAIVLTATGSTNDTDGYLTAVELAEYQLDARLLVLSACDTGVGRYVLGDGVQGLPVGAFLAGSENTLMSLWAVVDDTTAEFTTTVFQKLLAGKTEAQAVAETKREFISSKSGERSKPLFWAPFVLYGI